MTVTRGNVEARRVARARGSFSASLGAVGRWFRRAGISGQLLSLLIVVAIFAVGTRGRFLSAANLQVILSLAAIPAIIAVGLHQVVVLGGIDLSVEGVVALCVVFVGLLLQNKFNANNVGLWIIPITLGIGGAAGFVSGICNTRLRIPSFIATLGISWILWGLAVYVSQGQTVAILDARFQGVVTGAVLGVPILAIIAIVLVLVLQIVQDNTRFGRYLYAIGGDEVLARAGRGERGADQDHRVHAGRAFLRPFRVVPFHAPGQLAGHHGKQPSVSRGDRGGGGRGGAHGRDRRRKERRPRCAHRHGVE